MCCALYRLHFCLSRHHAVMQGTVSGASGYISTVYVLELDCLLEERDVATKETMAAKQNNTQGSAIAPTDIEKTDIKSDNEITEMKLVEQAFIYLNQRSIPWEVRRMRKEVSCRRKAESLKSKNGDLLHKKKDMEIW